MGLNKSALKVFLNEDTIRPLYGKIMCLGKQDIFIKPDEITNICNSFGKKITHANLPLSPKKIMADSGFPDDAEVFKLIGFNDIKSLDGSEYEGADYIFDLNKRITNSGLKNCFDFVFDGGTIEHIFNIPIALQNIYSLLKNGGRIMHISPSSNHIDHGFYMFSPTFFWDYYSANNWILHTCQVFRYTTNLYDGDWVISDYLPGCLHRISMGGLDENLYGIICVAEKTKQSSFNKIPIQGMYSSNLWKKKNLSSISRNAESIMLPQIDKKGLNLKISAIY